MTLPLAFPVNSLALPVESFENRWLKYFDIRGAVGAVLAHVETLPSSRTPERLTYRAYWDGLKYFLEWAGGELVTEDVLLHFIAHLAQKGLKSSTIRSKYLAPVRLYLNKLAGQHITGFTGEEREYIQDCREHMRAAARLKLPKDAHSTSVPPLWSPQFTRLTLAQVNAVLRAIDRTKLNGQRDYALLHLAFSAGLRLSEMQRLTLGALTPLGAGWLVTVRGKRGNLDPVPISAAAAQDILAWVDAYNGGLREDDPRRICASTPLWQPLLQTDHYAQIGINHYKPSKGLSKNALAVIIGRRTGDVLGVDYELAAHDTRRTCAAIAYEAGMALPDIQALLRHKDAAVTMRYVGNKPDYESRTLGSYVKFG